MVYSKTFLVFSFDLFYFGMLNCETIEREVYLQHLSFDAMIMANKKRKLNDCEQGGGEEEKKELKKEEMPEQVQEEQQEAQEDEYNHVEEEEVQTFEDMNVDASLICDFNEGSINNYEDMSNIKVFKETDEKTGKGRNEAVYSEDVAHSGGLPNRIRELLKKKLSEDFGVHNSMIFFSSSRNDSQTLQLSPLCLFHLHLTQANQFQDDSEKSLDFVLSHFKQCWQERLVAHFKALFDSFCLQVVKSRRGLSDFDYRNHSPFYTPGPLFDCFRAYFQVPECNLVRLGFREKGDGKGIGKKIAGDMWKNLVPFLCHAYELKNSSPDIKDFLFGMFEILDEPFLTQDKLNDFVTMLIFPDLVRYTSDVCNQLDEEEKDILNVNEFSSSQINAHNKNSRETVDKQSDLWTFWSRRSRLTQTKYWLPCTCSDDKSVPYVFIPTALLRSRKRTLKKKNWKGIYRGSDALLTFAAAEGDMLMRAMKETFASSLNDNYRAIANTSIQRVAINLTNDDLMKFSSIFQMQHYDVAIFFPFSKDVDLFESNLMVSPKNPKINMKKYFPSILTNEEKKLIEGMVDNNFDDNNFENIEKLCKKSFESRRHGVLSIEFGEEEQKKRCLAAAMNGIPWKDLADTLYDAEDATTIFVFTSVCPHGILQPSSLNVVDNIISYPDKKCLVNGKLGDLLKEILGEFVEDLKSNYENTDIEENFFALLHNMRVCNQLIHLISGRKRFNSEVISLCNNPNEFLVGLHLDTEGYCCACDSFSTAKIVEKFCNERYCVVAFTLPDACYVQDNVIFEIEAKRKIEEAGGIIEEAGGRTEEEDDDEDDDDDDKEEDDEGEEEEEETYAEEGKDVQGRERKAKLVLHSKEYSVSLPILRLYGLNIGRIVLRFQSALFTSIARHLLSIFLLSAKGRELDQGTRLYTENVFGNKRMKREISRPEKDKLFICCFNVKQLGANTKSKKNLNSLLRNAVIHSQGIPDVIILLEVKSVSDESREIIEQCKKEYGYAEWTHTLSSFYRGS